MASSLSNMGLHQLETWKYGLDLDKGDMIEGCLPENNIDRFSDKLKEGLIYEIDSYILTAPHSTFKVSNHAYRIRIGYQTSLKEINLPVEGFPYYAHNAKPFEVLEKRVRKNETLSDVFGVVYKVSEILESKSGSDPRRHVYIKNDSNKSVIVTLWAEQAERFNAQALCDASKENNVAVLFLAMAVGNYQGMLAFKSTPSTKWHFDPPRPEIQSLYESLQHERCIIEWEGQGPAEAVVTEETLSGLAARKLQHIIGESFILKVRVTQINNPTDWWFYSCQKCFQKMVDIDGSRRCPACKGTAENQRYTISLRAEDIHPEATYNEIISDFVFFDTQGLALTGHAASLLVSQAKGRHGYTPPSITETIGKTYTITAVVNQDTFDKKPGHLIFKVSKVEPLTDTILAEGTSPPLSLTAASNDDQQATPIKDIASSPIMHAQEEASSAKDGKKRKESTAKSETSTKRAKTGAKETSKTSKALFQEDQ